MVNPVLTITGKIAREVPIWDTNSSPPGIVATAV